MVERSEGHDVGLESENKDADQHYAETSLDAQTHYPSRRCRADGGQHDCIRARRRRWWRRCRRRSGRRRRSRRRERRRRGRRQRNRGQPGTGSSGTTSTGTSSGTSQGTNQGTNPGMNQGMSGQSATGTSGSSESSGTGPAGSNGTGNASSNFASVHGLGRRRAEHAHAGLDRTEQLHRYRHRRHVPAGKLLGLRLANQRHEHRRQRHRERRWLLIREGGNPAPNFSTLR